MTADKQEQQKEKINCPFDVHRGQARFNDVEGLRYHLATRHDITTLADLLAKIVSNMNASKGEHSIPWFTVGQPIECAACHTIVEEGHSYCLDKGKFYCYDCHE